MTRLVKKHPALFSVALLVLAIPFVIRMSATMAATALPVAATDLASTLIRAGLDPDALAAAGVSSGQATTVVDDFETAIAAEPTRLSTAGASYQASKVSSDQFRRLIQSGRGSAEDVTSYQTAMSDLQTAESALDDWCDAGTATLSGAQVAVLDTIKGNRHWKLDIELLALDRTEAEWVQVRDALAHERISAKLAEPVAGSVSTFLATCRSNAAVSTAKASSTANAAGVKTAWSSAIN